jgi:hypothetical protein
MDRGDTGSEDLVDSVVAATPALGGRAAARMSSHRKERRCAVGMVVVGSWCAGMWMRWASCVE